ncbi:MMPL family transporter [Streptomyces hirsutus]
MGLAAAGTVAVAVLVALTLLPAFLSFAGKKILPRKQRHAGGYTAEDGTVAEGFGFTWGRLVTKLRIPLLVIGILGLGALTLPAQDMRIALPDAGTAAEGSPAREAYDLTSEGFGEGFNGRLIAVVNGEDAQSTGAAAEKATALIKDTDGILTVAPPQLNEQGTTALLAVIPEAGPTAVATEDAVHDIRDRVADIEGADIALTGATALGIDVSEKLADALPVYLLLVVGLSILLLMLVFRSVLVPLKAAWASCSPWARPSASPSPSSRRATSPAWWASTPPARW